MILRDDIRKILNTSSDPVAKVQTMQFLSEREARAAAQFAVDLQLAHGILMDLDDNHSY